MGYGATVIDCFSDLVKLKDFDGVRRLFENTRFCEVQNEDQFDFSVWRDKLLLCCPQGYQLRYKGLTLGYFKYET